MKKQCKNCGKELRDEDSMERGFGPECWNKQKAKGTLPILVTFRTGVDRTDGNLFPNQASEYDFVIALDAKDIFDSKYQYASNSGIQITSEVMHTGIFQWMKETIEHADATGNAEVLIYARRHLIPAKLLPEVAPNLMGKQKNESFGLETEWVPFMTWNTKRIELMSMKPKTWELKDDKLQLVYANDFTTGSLFVEEDDLPDHLEGDEFSEKYAELYGDMDWIPTREFEEWMDGEKTRLWKENQHLKFFKEILKEKNIVLSVDKRCLAPVIGDEWQGTTEAWNLASEYHSQLAMDMAKSELDDHCDPMKVPAYPVEILDYYYDNPYAWVPELHNFYGDVDDMDAEQLEAASKAALAPFCEEIYIRFVDLLSGTNHDDWNGNQLWRLKEMALDQYWRDTTDSLLVKTAKKKIWGELGGSLARWLRMRWEFNMECEWGDVWEDETSWDYNAWILFAGVERNCPANPSMGYESDRDELLDAIIQPVKSSLKRMIPPVFKTGNEIFEKKNYD